MKSLSSLERTVLECLGKQSLLYTDIQEQSGLHENVCFNIIQALIIRGIIHTDGVRYKIKETLSPLMLEEINGVEARKQNLLS